MDHDIEFQEGMEQNNFISKRNLFFSVYYVLLVVVTLFLSKPEYQPEEFIRYAYAVAVVVPLFFGFEFANYVIPFFVGFSSCGLNQLLPSNPLYVAIVCLIFVLLNGKRVNSSIPFIFLVFFLFINAILFGFRVTLWASLIYVIVLMNTITSVEDLKDILLSIAFLSLFISFLFALYSNHFVVDYGNSGIERSGWINPNVLSSHIGCGIVASIILLLRKEFTIKNVLIKFMLISNIILSSSVVIALASRGSFVSAAIVMLVVFLTSDISKKWKFFILIVSIIIVFYSLQGGLFDLLMLRAESGAERGDLGTRTIIWGTKLTAFNNLNLVNQIFGIGIEGCDFLGVDMSSHNDYLTCLIACGYVGSALFLFFIVNITLKIFKQKNITAFSLFAFIACECFVLEPLFRGYLLFFILVLVMMKSIEYSILK